MSHNTPLQNARFKLQFTTTNLRHMLGEPDKFTAQIEQARKWIAETEKEIARLETEIQEAHQ